MKMAGTGVAGKEESATRACREAYRATRRDMNGRMRSSPYHAVRDAIKAELHMPAEAVEFNKEPRMRLHTQRAGITGMCRRHV
jgi:hypothetical protein